MPERHERVVLKLDTTGFAEAMGRAAAAVERLVDHFTLMVGPSWRAHLEHQRRHHRRESPAASAMHAAYDRRRRARRRRR